MSLAEPANIGGHSKLQEHPETCRTGHWPAGSGRLGCRTGIRFPGGFLCYNQLYGYTSGLGYVFENGAEAAVAPGRVHRAYRIRVCGGLLVPWRFPCTYPDAFPGTCGPLAPTVGLRFPAPAAATDRPASAARGPRVRFRPFPAVVAVSSGRVSGCGVPAAEVFCQKRRERSATCPGFSFGVGMACMWFGRWC